MQYLKYFLSAFAAVAVSQTLPPPDADGTYTLTAPGIRAKVAKSLPRSIAQF
jgi:hypothetical protein